MGAAIAGLFIVATLVLAVRSFCRRSTSALNTTAADTKASPASASPADASSAGTPLLDIALAQKQPSTQPPPVVGRAERVPNRRARPQHHANDPPTGTPVSNPLARQQMTPR
eukprot:CAMPEP_0174842670 /NCGR_PEP_ID=MMETSP1114-20130205/10056_1 /TAXON_ID=312471 /ORGANISM="Neobodo designis, Strain CCAP 1951/1" /LENGTH=111 /DNA_ID=CAMNT_0016076877 /DNA_START=18 /DNA_END=353 /DNA_ORIENTATION=+